MFGRPMRENHDEASGPSSTSLYPRAADGPVAVRFDPPPGLGPAAVGVLVDGRVGEREVAAMLLDLSLRGWYTMDTADGHWAFVTPSCLPPRDDALTEAEKRLLAAVFRPSPAMTSGERVPRQYVSMASLQHRLQGHMEQITQALGASLVEAGLMRSNPAKAGLLARGRLLTEEGQAARSACLGYRLYLQRAEAGSLAQGDADGFVGGALAYAVALGVVGVWAERLGPRRVTGTSNAAMALRNLNTNPMLVAAARQDTPVSWNDGMFFSTPDLQS